MKRFSWQKLIIFLILAGFMHVSFLAAGQSQPDKTIHVVFRYDDFSAKSPTQTELKIIQSFQKNESSLTFGVIPFICAGDQHDPSPQDTLALPRDKRKILSKAAQQGIVDPALHGFSHQTLRAEFLSEFTGADYQNQLEMLEKAKRYLENVTQNPINTFIPPWNRYDRQTLRALEKLNFKTLSASENEPALKTSGLNFLPFSVGLPHLKEAVQAARTSTDHQPLLVVLFHGYDFESSGDSRAHMTFKEFSSLLKWLNAQKDVQILSINQAVSMTDQVGALRYAANKKHNILTSLLPPWLHAKPSKTSYRETRVLTRTRWKVFGFYLVLIAVAAAGSFFLGKRILPRSPSAQKAARIAGFSLAVGVAILVFHDLEASMKGLSLASLMVGAFIGTLFPSFASE